MLAIVAAFVSGAVFEFYYVALLPALMLLFYFYFFYTEQLFYFLGFSTPLSVLFKDIGGGFGLSVPAEPILFLLFIGMLIRLAGNGTFDQKLLTNSLSIVILLDLGWMLVTAATSTLPLVSLKYFMMRTMFVTVCYFGMAQLFRKYSAMKIFLWGITIATAILVVYTLSVHAKGGFTRTYAYTAMRPFLPDHGMYGAAITFFVPLLFVFAVWGKNLRLTVFGKGFALVLFGITVTGVILSFTRASWLSLGVAFGVMLLLFLRFRFRTLLIVASTTIVLFLAFQDTILHELSRNKQDSDDDISAHLASFSNVSTDPSNLERLNRWSCAYRMYLDKPVLGFGPGTYTYKYAPYQISSEKTLITTHAGDQGNVHSEFLRPFTEQGTIGGILFFAMVLIAVAKGFHIFYFSSNGYSKFMALGVLMALVTYFSHGFLNNYSDFDKIAVPMWSLMAMLTALETYHMDKETMTEQEIVA